MVTGICIPCQGMQHAAQVAHDLQLGANVLKVGRDGKQWYCVLVFNQGQGNA